MRFTDETDSSSVPSLIGVSERALPTHGGNAEMGRSGSEVEAAELAGDAHRKNHTGDEDGKDAEGGCKHAYIIEDGSAIATRGCNPWGLG